MCVFISVDLHNEAVWLSRAKYVLKNDNYYILRELTELWTDCLKHEFI